VHKSRTVAAADSFKEIHNVSDTFFDENWWLARHNYLPDVFLGPGSGGGAFLRSIGKLSPDHTVSRPRL
jgi:hypothetical protein